MEALLLEETMGRDRMFKKQFSVVHLASRAWTPLDTEPALR